MRLHYYRIASSVVLFVLVAFMGCSKRSSGDQSEADRQTEAAPQASSIAGGVGSSKFTPLEMQIHDYSQAVGDDYTMRFGIEKGEALALIATAQEFKKSIVEVARIYDLIENSKRGDLSTEAEIDALNMRRFKNIGFQQREGVWYYADQMVNMGTPLPTPESMKPKQPDGSKELVVMLETATIVSDLKTLQVKGRTNLPDETELMIHLSCPALKYSAEDRAVVRNGRFESSLFSDAKRPLGRLGDGEYHLEITTPTVNVLNRSVAEILGNEGKNMTGKLVKFDEIFGNTVNYSRSVNVQ